MYSVTLWWPDVRSVNHLDSNCLMWLMLLYLCRDCTTVNTAVSWSATMSYFLWLAFNLKTADTNEENKSSTTCSKWQSTIESTQNAQLLINNAAIPRPQPLISQLFFTQAAFFLQFGCFRVNFFKGCPQTHATTNIICLLMYALWLKYSTIVIYMKADSFQVNFVWNWGTAHLHKQSRYSNRTVKANACFFLLGYHRLLWWNLGSLHLTPSSNYCYSIWCLAYKWKFLAETYLINNINRISTLL